MTENIEKLLIPLCDRYAKAHQKELTELKNRETNVVSLDELIAVTEDYLAVFVDFLEWIRHGQLHPLIEDESYRGTADFVLSQIKKATK